jgi:hypothetical protein
MAKRSKFAAHRAAYTHAVKIRKTMSSQRTTFISPEEYLAQERLAGHKSEYFKGEVFAMSGATPRNVWIVSNLNGNLWQQLKGKPCRISDSDFRLRVMPAGLYTYPDVMVVCGEPRYAEDQKDTLVNPVLSLSRCFRPPPETTIGAGNSSTTAAPVIDRIPDDRAGRAPRRTLDSPAGESLGLRGV